MSNLPPGVTESMLPGSRPQDRAFEHLMEFFHEWLDEHNIGTYEDDTDQTFELFDDAVYEALSLVVAFTRDPHEEAIRKSKCEDCGSVLGREWVQEERTRSHVLGDGTHEEYVLEVHVHKVCPGDDS